MGRSSGRNRKNFREVLRDRLMDDKPKGVIGAEEKDLGNLQMKRLGSREQGFDYEKRWRHDEER
jgi:hypothetical protein